MSLVHIHEALNMIYDAQVPFTKSSLQSNLQNKFGEEVQFTTCGEHQLNIDEAISFMQQRGKIAIEGDQIVPLGSSCNH